MVLRKALSDVGRGWKAPRCNDCDLPSALRWYENTRRRKVKAVSWVTTQQVSRSESALKPAAMISDRFMTWALATFLRSVSHRRISAEISRDLAGATTTHLVSADE
jgi:FAD-dependent urate hydroxylase